MSDRKVSEETIFHIASKLEDAADQSAYLDHVCGDDVQLRNRVLALLEVDDPDHRFLRPSAEGAPTIDVAPITEAPGHQIGPYKLLQEIGEGGFGVVFMAEQQSPIVRKVALKVIKPGMDSHCVVARFEAERQALALMDHPNIAHILDGGVTDSGRPYFVMELVKGVPITDYCDGNELSTEERLGLFIDVCLAVEHAHQKGVIHRDLSPSNIMVTLHDGKPVAKVIDFGVSKAIHQRLTEKTLFTTYGQMIGKPQYMSPEQAEMSGLDVDTRCDVYSLGILLYELLTGNTPLEAKRLRAAGYAEMQKLIREEEPPMPSTRLTGNGEELTIIAKHRSATPERLHRLVRGDLDWIVMKALEKDRVRRYQSASDLQRDIERCLNDDAVSACPPSKVYRTRKFMRRNKLAVAVGGAISVSLILGLIATSSALMLAKHETDRAVQAEAEAETKADEVDLERQRAEELASSLSRTLYAADMNNAMTAWERIDFRHLRSLLDKYAQSPLRGWEWYHLQNLLKVATPAAFATPPMSPLRIYISPTNEQIVATHSGGAVLSVIGTNGATVRSAGELEAGTWHFSYAAFSSDGQQFVHPSNSFSSLIVRDSGSVRIVNEINIPVDRATANTHISAASFSPDGKYLAMAVEKQGVEFYDRHAERFAGHLAIPDLGKCEVLEFSSDGEFLAVSSTPITVWDVQERRKVHELEGHTQAVTSIQYVRDDEWLISASRDRRIHVWDMTTGERLRTLGPLGGEARCLAYDPKEDRLAAGLRNRILKVWSLPDFVEVDEVRGYNGLYAVDYFSDGRLIYGAMGGSLVVREREERRPVDRIPCGGWPTHLEFSKCGQHIICLANPIDEASPNQSPNVLRSIRIDRPDLDSIALPPVPFDPSCIATNGANDANLLAIGARDSSRAVVIDLDQCRTVFDSLSLDSIRVECICFDHEGRSVLCGLRNGQVMQLHIGGPGHLHRIYAEHHDARVTDVAALQDGSFVSVAGDGSLRIWKDGHSVSDTLGVAGKSFGGLDTHGQTIAFSLFGGLNEEGHRISLVDSTGRRRGFYGHTFAGLAVKIIENGKTLVSLGGDREIKLWSTDTLEQRLAIRESEIYCSLAVSPDEATIAAGTREGTIFLYRAPRP